MEKLDAHSAEFRQFFLVHYETLCIRAFRLVHDRNLSEDIVQDVFLMLWKRRTEIDFSRPVYFLSQTTQSIGLFERLGAEMRRRAADAGQVYIDDTICRQVSNREQHLTEFSGRFDAVVFVCGRKSSNGKVLSEVCRRANPRTHVVEEASEIDPAWFEGAATVGICGATSTPKWLMQDVADAIGNLNSEFRIQNS